MPTVTLNNLAQLKLYPIKAVVLWASDETEEDPGKYSLQNLVEDSNVAFPDITRPTGYGGQRWIASRIIATISMHYSDAQHALLTAVVEGLRGRRIAAQITFDSDLPGRTTATLNLTYAQRVEVSLRKETAGEFLRSTLTLTCMTRSISDLII